MNFPSDSSFDTVHAFIEMSSIEGNTQHGLSGLNFAVKDNIDVAGMVTGAGNPHWRDKAQPKKAHASIVESLLAAGTNLLGKTHMDEFAFGIYGDNHFYGTPENVNAPDSYPGGSSSGSASAVAAGLVDFALGTDTSCSVRFPAALCGIYGIRTTHQRLAMKGVMALAPSFDTLGWFAKDALTFERVGETLFAKPLSSGCNVFSEYSLTILEDAFELADDVSRDAFLQEANKVAALFAKNERLGFLEKHKHFGLSFLWFYAHQSVVKEAYEIFGKDVEAGKIISDKLTEKSLSTGKELSAEALRECLDICEGIRRTVEGLVSDNSILCLPSTVGYPISRDADQSALNDYARNTLCLYSLAGLAGLPQINIPFDGETGKPKLGLSLIGPKNSDEVLLALAVKLSEKA